MSLDSALELLDGLVARSPASPGRIALSIDGPLAYLVVEHAEARNALTARMMRQLGEAVRTLSRAQDVLALIVRSAEGGAFCAGGHLREVQQALGTPEAGHQMALAMGEVLDALSSLPIVSIAAMEGPAIGGGSELALTFDFRVMGQGSSLHFVHTRLGVVPGWGGAGRLVDVVGRAQALAILLDASPMDAARCEELGLAQVVEAGQALAVAEERSQRLIRRGPAARAAKAAVLARGRRGADERRAEAAAFASVWGSPEHLAALERVLARLA